MIIPNGESDRILGGFVTLIRVSLATKGGINSDFGDEMFQSPSHQG